MEKVILLALDGLSWNLIEELISNKELNYLEEIVHKGVSGVLEAEDFLSSPKIFCSIFTGKKVAKHGIRDFYSKEEDLRTNQIWDILHDLGFKVGVYRALSVWSPKKFAGFCIPSPMLLEKDTHPKELAFIGELDKKARSEKFGIIFLVKTFFRLVLFQFPMKYLLGIIKRAFLLFRSKGLEARMHLLKEIELIIHTNLYFNLLKKYNLDFSVFFDYSFDTLGHIYWRNRNEKSKYFYVLPNVYKYIDTFIGKVYNYAKRNNYHLIICSDHGFEKIEKKNQRNFRTINVLYLLRELKFYYDVYGIYMTGSVVFRSRPNSSRALEDFKKALEEITCNGKTVLDIKQYEKKLIVKIKDFIGDNKNYNVRLPNGKVMRIDSIIDFNPGHTGDHSNKYGVFIITGPKIKKGIKINNITPYDITPTILKLLEMNIPPEMDGRPLDEAFVKNE
ncbi:MAG: alkaline phosphatase family protein [Promethearchaeota archaeon]